MFECIIIMICVTMALLTILKFHPQSLYCACTILCTNSLPMYRFGN